MRTRSLSIAVPLALAAGLLFLEAEIVAVLGSGGVAGIWTDRLVIPGVLFGLSFFLRGPFRCAVLTVGTVALTLVLLGDRASIEFSGEPLNVHRAAASGQIWQIRDSIASLFGLDGACLLAAALLLPGAGWWAERRRSRAGDLPRGRSRWIVSGLFVAGCAARLVFQWNSVAPDADQRWVIRRHGALMCHLLEFRGSGRSAPNRDIETPQRRAIAATLAHKALLNRTASPFFGLAKGRNVVFVQLESFEHFLLDLRVPGGEVTPNLNRLAKDGLRWRGLLNMVAGGRSSDTEFSALVSLPAHPTRIVALEFADRNWTSLPKVLKSAGLATLSFSPFNAEFWNCGRTHASYGIEQPHFVDRFRPGRKIGWGLSDEDFMVQSAEFVIGGPGPYFAFHTTLSSHHPFNDIPEELQDWKVGPVDSNVVANYLRIVRYTDGAVGKWLDRMRAGGQLEKCLLVFYGDHNAGFTRAGRAAVGRLTGRDHSRHESDRVLLVVAIPGEEEFVRTHRAEFEDVLGGSFDLAPTVLHLLGLPSPVGFYGTHLFVRAEDRDPVVLPTGDFLVHKGVVRALPDSLPMLSASERAMVESQAELARTIIENDGQALVADLRTADDTELRRVASAAVALEPRTEPIPENGSTQASFPRVEFPVGQALQTIKTADTGGGFPPRYVARGGGIFRGLRGSNCLEALNRSAALGYRMIQVDLSWTSDGHLVLLRDWSSAKQRLLEGGAGQLDLAGFRAARPIHGTTQLALEDLVGWLDGHPHTAIVTSIGESNLRGLAKIATDHPGHRGRFLPLVATGAEYDGARKLGFDRVLLAVGADLDDAAVVKTVRGRGFYAAVLPNGRDALARVLDPLKLTTYLQVVNERYPWTVARAGGIDGAFTDELGPGHMDGDRPPVLPVWTVERGASRPLDRRLLPAIPPPRFRWESGPDLELHNPTDAPIRVTLRTANLRGEPGTTRELPLAPGDATRVWLRQLFLDDAGRVAIEGGGARAVCRWGLEHGTRAELEVFSAAHDRFVMQGPALGVAGYSVTIVNPFSDPASVTVAAAGGDPERIHIPPLGTEIRAFQVPAGLEAVRVEVTGDFVVVQPMHWDAGLRTMRER